MKFTAKEKELADLILANFSKDVHHHKDAPSPIPELDQLESLNKSIKAKEAPKKDIIDYSKCKRDELERGIEKIENDINPSEEDNIKSIWGCTNDHRKERDIYERSNKEKLSIAQEYKDEGNKAFQEGDFDKAAFFYKKCQLYLTYTIADSDEEEDLYQDLLLKTNLNLAQLKINRKEFREAYNYCYQALNNDKTNIKAKYRMAICHIELNEFELAKTIIDELKDTPEFKILSVKLTQAKKSNERERKNLAGFLKTEHN